MFVVGGRVMYTRDLEEGETLETLKGSKEKGFWSLALEGGLESEHHATAKWPQCVDSWEL